MSESERDFVRPDLERARRKGVPEVILAEGKSIEHAVEIARIFLERQGRAILSRVTPELEARLRSELVEDAALEWVSTCPGSGPAQAGHRGA